MRIGKFVVLLALAAALVGATWTVSLAEKAGKKDSPKAPIQGKDAGPIVQRVIKAYGGEDAIKAAKSLYVKADITAEMRGDKGTYVRYLERPRKLRVEIKYTKSSELRILNGNDGWRKEGASPLVKVKDFQYNSMVYQYKQLDVPYGLVTDAYRVRWSGEAVVGGKRCDILSLKDEDKVPIDIYVDVKTGLIVKTVGYFLIREQLTDLSAEFSDFRKVGGVMVPFTITNFSQGFNIGVTTVKECKVDAPMKAGLFKP